jgi:ribosome-associated protein
MQRMPLLASASPASLLSCSFEESMSRKPTKGYFVRGQFVATGSELDLELKRELKGSVEMSKTDMKRESDRLQDLGEQLLTLNSTLFKKLVDAEHLPEKLVITLADAKRITNFEGRRRQMQFVGKLMRKLEDESIAAIEAALEEQRKPSAEATLALHQAEQWRDRLVADDDALTGWMALAPQTDVQHLRTLIRQARKDAQGVKERPGEAQRHGKAFRDIFQLVRTTLNPATADEGAEPTDGE